LSQIRKEKIYFQKGAKTDNRAITTFGQSYDRQ